METSSYCNALPGAGDVPRPGAADFPWSDAAGLPCSGASAAGEAVPCDKAMPCRGSSGREGAAASYRPTRGPTKSNSRPVCWLLLPHMHSLPRYRLAGHLPLCTQGGLLRPCTGQPFMQHAAHEILQYRMHAVPYSVPYVSSSMPLCPSSPFAPNCILTL